MDYIIDGYNQDGEIEEKPDDSKRARRVRNFAVVVQPHKFESNKKFMEYLEIKKDIFPHVYILHDKCKYNEFDDEVKNGDKKIGDNKEPHYHILIHTKSPMTIKSFLKFFAGWVNYAMAINNPESYIMYMCHDTPQCIIENKLPYDPSLLKGDKKMISNVYGKTLILYNLEKYAEWCKERQTVADMILNVSNSNEFNDYDRKILIDTLTTHSHLICCMSNQEINEYWRRRANTINT